jgi:hypothetical protein
MDTGTTVMIVYRLSFVVYRFWFLPAGFMFNFISSTYIPLQGVFQKDVYLHRRYNGM